MLGMVRSVRSGLVRNRFLSVAPLKVAICGAGTVGGGVIEILSKRQDEVSSLKRRLEVSKILVRDVSKKRDFEGIPSDCVFTDSVDDVINDEDVDVVVELVGGVDVAKELTLGALAKGKHVVSANKALIAAHGEDIVNVMNENPSAKFGFEASVCGGIPVIHALQRDFLPDRVKRLSGVFNGTTNFILSSMELQGRGYDEVLKEAQDLGFAEADPTADVGGFDARSKLCILARLALGVRLNESEVPLTGMQAISKDDFDYAKKLNCSIKLLGVVSKSNSGKINAYVSPMLVPMDNSISKIHGATNIVEVMSESLQRSFLIGEGAGRYPTANSVVSDLFQIANGVASDEAFPLEDNTSEYESNFEGNFYVRIQVKDELGIIRRCGGLCEKHGISVHAIYQEPIRDSANMPFVLSTETTRHENVVALCDDLEKEKFVVERPFSMPFLH